jgi:hypothetical protein
MSAKPAPGVTAITRAPSTEMAPQLPGLTDGDETIRSMPQDNLE